MLIKLMVAHDHALLDLEFIHFSFKFFKRNYNFKLNQSTLYIFYITEFN